MSFDPILVLNKHIALLTLLNTAEQEVIERKGVVLALAKWTGRLIQGRLEQSKVAMRANKMWVQEKEIGVRRYQYSLFGRREVYEIAQADIDLNVGMILHEVNHKLDNIPVE